MNLDIEKIGKILPITSDSKWNLSHWQWWLENWFDDEHEVQMYHYEYEDPEDHEKSGALSVYFPLLMKGQIATPNGKIILAGDGLNGSLHYRVNVHGWETQDWNIDNTTTALENVLGRKIHREDVFIPTLDGC